MKTKLLPNIHSCTCGKCGGEITTNDFSALTDALKTITDNPEGGEVNIKVAGTEKVLKFSMPPIDQRHPPTKEDIEKMQENLKGFNP
jgi:hypothetical protein